MHVCIILRSTRLLDVNFRFCKYVVQMTEIAKTYNILGVKYIKPMAVIIIFSGFKKQLTRSLVATFGIMSRTLFPKQL